MTGILEARLVVSGEDRTREMFAAILRRMDAVLAKAKALGQVSETSGRALNAAGVAMERVDRGLAAAAARLDRAAMSMERAAAVTARTSRETATRGGFIPAPGGGVREHRIRRGDHGFATALTYPGTPHGNRHALAAGGYTIGGAAGAIGAVVIGEGAIHGVEKGAERQHERVREDISGMTPAERKEAEERAAVLAARYPMIDQTAIMHSLRNARAITGSYEDAAKIADDVLRTRVVAQAARPGQDVEADFDKLLKALEQKGVTQDPAEFSKAMKAMQRVLAVEGDTLTPESIYAAFKYSRQALPGASNRFMLGAAPAIAQEMGGASFGNALSSFNRAIVSGRMDGRALETAVDLGLIDPADVDMKNGKPTHVKSPLKGGHGFKNWKVAASDPDRYIYDTLSAALTAHNITDPAEIGQIANLLFSNRMAGDFVNKFLTQRARIEKNQANLDKVPDDPAARVLTQDPLAGWQGLKNAFDNLSASILSSGSGVTGALNTVSGYMNDAAARVQGVKTDHQQQAENQQKYGLNDPRDFSKAPIDDLVAAKQKALADDAAKVAAKRLELKGLIDEIAKRDAARDSGGFWGRLGFGGQETGSLIVRAHDLQAELKDIETAAARLRAISDAFDRLQRAREDSPGAHLINQKGGAAVPGFGHAAFPLGSSYGYVDPSTGRGWGIPAPPPMAPSPGAGSDAQDRVVRALQPNPYGSLGGKQSPSGPIEAELKGQANVNVKVDVGPSSNLLAIVKKAEAASASGNLRMNVGTGAPGTSPAGRTPSGR